MTEGDVSLHLESGRIGAHSGVRLHEPAPDAITIDTVRRFKGLERQVVVLLAPDAVIDEPELAYVALSRPRSRLFVIGSARAVAFLKESN
jgi:hypothetical protein